MYARMAETLLACVVSAYPRCVRKRTEVLDASALSHQKLQKVLVLPLGWAGVIAFPTAVR